MIASDLSRAAAIGLMAVGVVADVPTIAIYALAVIGTVAATPFAPAQGALLPDLAGSPQQLTAANASSSTIDSAGMFVGRNRRPLLAATSAAVVFASTAALFVWSALNVARIGHDARPARARGGGGGGGRPRGRPAAREPRRLQGEISAQPGLRLLVLLLAAETFVDGAFDVLLVVLALETLDIGAGGVGLLNSVGGIGARRSAGGRRAHRTRSPGNRPRLRDRAVGPAHPPDRGVAGAGGHVRRHGGDRRGRHDRQRDERHASAAHDATRGARARLRRPRQRPAHRSRRRRRHRARARQRDRHTRRARRGRRPPARAGAHHLAAARAIDDEAALVPKQLDLLAASPIFAPLPGPTLEVLGRALESRQVPGGEAVFRQGARRRVLPDRVGDGGGDRRRVARRRARAGRLVRRDRAPPRHDADGDRTGDDRPQAAGRSATTSSAP